MQLPSKNFTHLVSINCGCDCEWAGAVLLLAVSLVLGADVPPPPLAFDTVSTWLLIDETAALVVPLVMAVAVVAPAWTCLLGSRSSCCRATCTHIEKTDIISGGSKTVMLSSCSTYSNLLSFHLQLHLQLLQLDRGRTLRRIVTTYAAQLWQ